MNPESIQTGFLDGNDRKHLTGAGLCLLLQLRKPHQQAGHISAPDAVLGRLLPSTRRERGDQQDGATELHRDENSVKIGTNSGPRGPGIDRHGLPPEWVYSNLTFSYVRFQVPEA
jgi:hypothetical protein